MNRRILIAAAAWLSVGWLLSGCPQGANSSFGRMDAGGGDGDVAEAPPGPDGVAVDEPIEPKTDPKAIGRGTATGGSETGRGEPAKISGGMFSNGPLEIKPAEDERLRYADDLKIVPKSPATTYLISGKSKKITLSFVVEVNWDPSLADAEWLVIPDNFEIKPQLRAVFVPADDHSHVFFCDAAQTADESGREIYTFSDIVVSEGRLRFFLTDTKSSDFSPGGFVSLPSGDPSEPFPANAGVTVYKAGVLKIQSSVISKTTQLTPQNDGRSLPLKF